MTLGDDSLAGFASEFGCALLDSGAVDIAGLVSSASELIVGLGRLSNEAYFPRLNDFWQRI